MAVTGRTHTMRRALVAAALVVTAAACSGDDEGVGEAAIETPTTAPSTEPVDRSDDETPEATDDEAVDDEPSVDTVRYEVPPPDSGPTMRILAEDDELDLTTPRFVQHVELVRHGVDAGVWTESEGTIAVLRAELGEIPRSSIDGLDLVITRSRSSLLHHAEELVDDPATPAADREELERLIADIVPPLEFFDDLDPGSDEQPSGFRRSDRPATAGDCVSPQLASFPRAESLEIDCWKMMTERVDAPTGGGTSLLRVVYPEELETRAEYTMEALIRSVEHGHEWTTAAPDTAVLLNPLPDPEATDDSSAWGVASATDPRSCVVSIFTTGSLATVAAYQQMVAHEQVHCLQFAAFGTLDDGARVIPSGDWVVEGVAEYLSHVIYPEGAIERDFIGEFMKRSVHRPLYEMSYEAWVWWQFLANESSPGDVFELHGRLIEGALAESVLAAEPGMAEKLQRFTIDLMTVGIPTESIPVPPSVPDDPLLVIDSPLQHAIGVDDFTAARFLVRYDESRLFEQTMGERNGPGAMQMARLDERMDRSAWLGLPPEIRSPCEEDLDYLMALTTVNILGYTVDLNVATADEYTCDPCLGGTWTVDNVAFRDAIMAYGMAQGGGLPPGVGGMSIDMVGPYYVRFTADGTGVAWRDDWAIVVSGQAHGMTIEIVTTIASRESFDYLADGERFTATNAVTTDYRTTVDMGDFPIGATVTPSAGEYSMFGVEGAGPGGGLDGPQSAEGSYTCDEHRLEIALDMMPTMPVMFDRVDDIPEPPLVIVDE